jgi:thiol-disulfide isomerase/thioredoxin
MDKFGISFFIFLCLFTFPPTSSGQTFQKFQAAPSLKLKTVSGDSADLRALKGKIVLVEFWASWCGPCRIRNRHLASLYHKYRSCGFEILCVSADENQANWKKAIETDSLDCIQGKTARGWHSPELKDWKVKFIPASYLIDREGKFLAIEPSIGVINAWLEELL